MREEKKPSEGSEAGSERRSERERLEHEQLARENALRVSRGLKPRDPKSDAEVEEFKADILLEEAGRIVYDMVQALSGARGALQTAGASG